MAGHELIDAYLVELRVSLGSFADVDAVIEEAVDHLLEAVDHLAAGGLTARDAQTEALARYGSAALVSKVCITESRKGAAVSTTFTRRAGLVAACLPVLLLVGMAGNEYFQDADDKSLGGQVHGASSGLVLPLALVAFLVGMFGLRARHRGLGRFGTAALVTVLLAPFVAAPFGWGAGYVALLMLGIAVILLGIGMLRAGVLPVLPLVLFIAGPIIAITINLALPALGYETYWQHLTPLVLTVIGFSWMGWYQWREPALDRPANGTPRAAAA